jgi:hypothetical protein
MKNLTLFSALNNVQKINVLKKLGISATSKNLNEVQSLFNNFTNESQLKALKSIDTSKGFDSELSKLEKLNAKSQYKGIYTIFKAIKDNSTLLRSIKTKKFEATELIGTMNCNQFIGHLKNPMFYSIDTVYNYAKVYELANEGDKKLISERGIKINDILKLVKSGEIEKSEALTQFLAINPPYKVTTKKVKNGADIVTKTLTFSENSQKYLLEFCPQIAKFYGIEAQKVETIEDTLSIEEQGLTIEEIEQQHFDNKFNEQELKRKKAAELALIEKM